MKSHETDVTIQSKRISRRQFLVAGLAAPLIVPRHVIGSTAGRLYPAAGIRR